MKKVILTVFSLALFMSCVSKKKYVALEEQNQEIKSQLVKERLKNEDLEQKFTEIQNRVDTYHNKINSLTAENNVKLETVEGAVINEETKAKMRKTLQNVDPALVSEAKTLKDSMNLAVSHNIQKSMKTESLNDDEDVNVFIDETMVMISVSDKLLFKTASTNISNKADKLFEKLANIIKSEPSIEVYIEGHTDSRSISNSRMKDNWDLSVLRATSVVRKLQNDYGVPPEQLIAAGRSSYHPLAANDSNENRSKNRRTRIALLPDINKFFALMSEQEK
jgi:chemotaxis protein MotB